MGKAHAPPDGWVIRGDISGTGVQANENTTAVTFIPLARELIPVLLATTKAGFAAYMHAVGKFGCSVVNVGGAMQRIKQYRDRVRTASTARELIAQITSGQLSSVDWVKRCSCVIDDTDDDIRAWTYVDRMGALLRTSR